MEKLNKIITAIGILLLIGLIGYIVTLEPNYDLAGCKSPDPWNPHIQKCE